MNAPRSAKKGFTLLELLLVIAIIAILAGLIIFNLNPAQRLRDTNDAKVQSDVASVASAAALFITDRQGQFASLRVRSMSTQTAFANTSLNKFLVNGGYMQSVPVAPTGYSAYEVRRSATTSAITVCGREGAPSSVAVCVTR